MPVLDEDAVRRSLAAGAFDGDENRTFWITLPGRAGDRVGLVRLMDLADAPDNAPLFDLRIAPAYRGRGIGGEALAWLTRHLFTEFPRIARIEATTRQDNVAMRRTFRSGGYVKEAHYRDAWPGVDGAVHDAVGYAVLRRDWLAGTVTAPDWDDEPGTENPPRPGERG